MVPPGDGVTELLDGQRIITLSQGYTASAFAEMGLSFQAAKLLMSQFQLVQTGIGVLKPCLVWTGAQPLTDDQKRE